MPHPVRRKIVAVAILSSIVAVGCREATTTMAPEIAREPELASEWESQLAELEAGERDSLEIAESTVDDEHIAALAAVGGKLRKLSLGRAKLSNASLDRLQTMPKLEEIVLKQAAIDDAGLVAIAKVSSLKRVNLPHANGTDRGLAALAGLPNLELLRIGGPRMTGSGLAAFESHSRLRFLHLIDAPIDAAALEAAAKITSLESLYVDGGRASDAAWEKLLRARPRLHVHLDQAHHDRDPKRHDHAH